MIKKFINKLLGRSTAEVVAVPEPEPVVTVPKGERVEVGKDVHGINPSLVDERAIRVVRTLAEGGFEAYIVGGAVRDLLVGLKPKDFDVATDATPEEVKSLFKRAFIIGRRFRIVHVVFGRGREHEVIEVSTFRAYLDTAAADLVGGNEKTSKQDMAGKSHVVDAAGRVLRDNVWGPQIEDAARRDFTVNAMYYDPQREIVVDYHHGIEDAKARVLRMIGDPPTRYREDPVRIVRVVRFAAKLGFDIEPKTREPIRAMSALLENVPASRLFDEMIKLLQTGHALASLQELRRQGLDRGVFPILDVVTGADGSGPDTFVELALKDTDRRVAEGRAVAPSFMLACMLWREVQERWSNLRHAGMAPFPALQQAIDAVFDARIGDISGRGKLAADMREIWMMQPRFERRNGNGAYTLIDQPRFRAGFDFLRLRADAAQIEAELADWWEDFSLGDDAEREALIASVREVERGRRGASPRGDRAPADRGTRGTAHAAGEAGGHDAADGVNDAAEGDADAGTEAGPDEASLRSAPAKKRRRRRRKPAAEGLAETSAPAAE